jgi:PAS domain S-box-containing protein
MSAETPPVILVVDDNPATRYSTSRVLRSAGFDIVEAATGGDALTLATRRLDLVVLDINLPDIDGFEVCRELRRRRETANVPVVHLSATFVNDMDKVHGLEAGADGYLTHPIEPPVLIASVKAFLRARQAEVAMRASEAKFKAVFDQALHGIALISDGMMFLDVNPAMARILGHDHDTIVGRHLSAFVPQAFEPSVEAIRTGLPATGSWRGAFPVVHADGRAIDLEWTVSIHSSPDVRLAIVTDVSDRKAIEKERERLLASERAARAEAERANSSKDEFLAALSHELRTPLNAIVGWSQVLKIKVHGGDPEMVQGVAAIERNARVQAQLISDLLDVSRIIAGKLSLDLQSFDPREAVEASIDALRPVAEAQGIAVEMALDPAAPALVWDPARFQQVVWNLLENALKFSEPGGKVRVELVNARDGLRLSVCDNGRGISPEFLPHIFDRFRQEDATTRRRHSGLGLGLAIVKRLVDAHGAAVTVGSAGEGHGATFTVTMPHVDRRVVSAHEQRRGTPDLHGVRVLVVEDDADARAFVQRVLRDAGAEVCEAGDVASALTLIGTFMPHVLVSDIGMPREDGYDLIRRVREGGYGADVLPAVALTAFAREEDRQRALGAGYQQHLAKPISVTRLLEITADLAALSGAAPAGD